MTRRTASTLPVAPSSAAFLATLAASLLAASPLAGCAERAPRHAAPGPAAKLATDAEAPGERTVPGGRLKYVNGVRVLELYGTPEEMGRAHGLLLGEDIRRAVQDVLRPETEPARWESILEGTRVMDRFQPERFRRELRALADASGVDYLTMVALQLFGDTERVGPGDDQLPRVTDFDGFDDFGDGDCDDSADDFEDAMLPENAGEGDEAPVDDFPDLPDLPDDDGTDSPIWKDGEGAPSRGRRDYQCTNFAFFGPATATGELIAGRNFDYWYVKVARYASLIIHYRPEGKRAFVTLTWAGVINGWTLMNDAGLCAANNLAYGESNSLEGVSTCFLLRLVIEEAGTVEEGIAVARKAPRAVGTAMLVAGGTPPDAVELEFDHAQLVVRRAHRGFVIADNTSRALGLDVPLGAEEDATGRYGTLLKLVKANHGRIDRTMNFAAAPGVAIASMNLHSAMLFPADLTFACSMGKVPACREPFRKFRMTAEGVVSAEE